MDEADKAVALAVLREELQAFVPAFEALSRGPRRDKKSRAFAEFGRRAIAEPAVAAIRHRLDALTDEEVLAAARAIRGRLMTEWSVLERTLGAKELQLGQQAKEQMEHTAYAAKIARDIDRLIAGEQT